jgi:guanine deaminase
MPHALRGPALSFTDDPFAVGIEAALRYEPDAIVAMDGGRITHFGPADEVEPRLAPATPVRQNGRDTLMTAGFIDCHAHFPQTPMIAACGTHLLDWLEKHAYPTEQKFVDERFARTVGKVFLQESLRNGITSGCIYSTVHPQSVSALFAEAESLGMRLATGKVLMNRNAPGPLLDTTRSGYDDSKALIRQWHGRGRLMYAITPRFAPSCTAEQLEATGALWQEHPDCYLQTHIAETRSEVAWAKELFPERAGYLDVYDHYGLCAPRAMFGHGIHLTEAELQRLHDTGAAIAHCPTSNFFLGNDCFDLNRAVHAERPVRVGLGTDIGAGTTLSIIGTLNEAYKAARMHGNTLSAGHAFYLATRGAARAMYLEDTVGSLAPGMEADLVVLDLKSTPLIDYRMGFCTDLEEALFIQMTLGDDRAVLETWVTGRLAHTRSADVGNA